MPRVRFTSHLQKFFPTLKQDIQIDGHTVAEIVAALDQRFPGLAAYIVDERGALRKHVNIFIGDEMISDRLRLQDQVSSEQPIFIMQALSGG
jgi:sulfur-carrier protein